jgi:hypothetical protein
MVNTYKKLNIFITNPKNMEIKKYEIDEIRNNKEIISKISNFIRETFLDISQLYSENSQFKKDVE